MPSEAVPVLSAEERAGIAVLHVLKLGPRGARYCASCGCRWPCWEARWLATYAALERERNMARVALQWLCEHVGTDAYNLPDPPAPIRRRGVQEFEVDAGG